MAETTVEKQALASAVLSDYKCFTSITLFYYCVTMMLLHNVSDASMSERHNITFRFTPYY